MPLPFPIALISNYQMPFSNCLIILKLVDKHLDKFQKYWSISISTNSKIILLSTICFPLSEYATVAIYRWILKSKFTKTALQKIETLKPSSHKGQPSAKITPELLETDMENSTSMDVEHQFSPTPNPTKRFGLRNSIQTNFGDDYVFQITPKDDWSSMAVSLSTNAVKLYSPVTGQYQGECKGHFNTINQISFSVPLSPHVLQSCSSDGTLRTWDTRTYNQVWSVNAGPSQEIFSFSFGGSADNLLAAGTKSQILFWDSRLNNKLVACLEESHTEDVTQVHFIPGQRSKLLSASVDGLMCIFNTDGEINDDDHLESVINVGTSIGKVGFFGDSYQKLWCLTHIESLSIWDWKDAHNDANLLEARTLASDSWALDHIDYFVDCHYPGEGDSLWVIGGTSGGALGYFPVDYKGAASLRTPEAILTGGHTGVVRTVLPMSGMKGVPQTRGIFGWTGGEDGRLSCWLSDDSFGTNRSWISSSLVEKSPKIRKKKRHSPY